MKDNDQLFKILIMSLIGEFLQAFVPDLYREVEIASLRFLDREQNRVRKLRRVDVLLEAKLSGQSCYILVLVEIQSQRDAAIGQRLFVYVSRLMEERNLPVFPIVLVAHAAPNLPAQDCFELKAGPFKVATIHYRNIVIKSLDWRKFLQSSNPAETALMSVMKIAPEDRVKAKAQIFRLLARLELDEKKLNVVAGFVDEYLELEGKEELEFEQELDKVGNRQEKAKIMRLMTSWEKKGLAQGRQEGREEGRQEGWAEGMLRARQLAIIDALEARHGTVPLKALKQVEKLKEETVLRNALRIAITTDSIAQFLKQI